MSEALPADDPGRLPTLARMLDLSRPSGNGGGVLVSGAETNGRYCVLELVVPPGGGPPPHRHDFEEMFVLLEGEIEFTVRGQPQTVRAPSVLNVPANAPHRFRNRSSATAHMLCVCTPAGLEEFFDVLHRRIEEERAKGFASAEAFETRRKALTRELAAQYRMELLED